MYFMPASCASLTHSSASNFTGLNCFASASYSRTGILARFMIHSPMPGTGFPFHSPAGIAYRPQWMNRPNFASRNQASRASFAGSAAGAGWAAARGPARRRIAVDRSPRLLFMEAYPFCFRRSSASATQPRRSLSAGTPGQVRLDVQDRSAVQHVHAPHAQAPALAREKLHDGEADRVRPPGRAGREDAVRRLQVQRHPRDELVALGPVEHPQDEQVRKALDVLEARLELRPQLEGALGTVLGAGAFRYVGLVAVGAADEADGGHLDGRLFVAHQVPPAPGQGYHSAVRLGIDGHTRLLVLTGAGVSAESGVPTFRDANGLWESHPIEKVATPEGFAEDPRLVWRFYSERRRKAKTVEPNPGHLALTAAESRLGDRFLLVTQNVDGLHRRAGSTRLVEMHGSLFETRCSRCPREPFPDDREYLGDPPPCPERRSRGHSALLRPAVVWFGEGLDPLLLRQTLGVRGRGPRGAPGVPGGGHVRSRVPGGGPRPAGPGGGRRGLARQRGAAGQREGLPPLRPGTERADPARPLRMDAVTLAALAVHPPRREPSRRSTCAPSIAKRVLAAADAGLKEPTGHLTASSSPRSGGGKHDFFSEGDYWWPDPANPGRPLRPARRDDQSGQLRRPPAGTDAP